MFHFQIAWVKRTSGRVLVFESYAVSYSVPNGRTFLGPKGHGVKS